MDKFKTHLKFADSYEKLHHFCHNYCVSQRCYKVVCLHTSCKVDNFKTRFMRKVTCQIWWKSVIVKKQNDSFFHHRFHTLKVLTKAEYTAVGYLVRRVQFEMEEQWAKVVDVSHRHSWKCAISWLRPTTCWHPVAPSDFEEEDRW